MTLSQGSQETPEVAVGCSLGAAGEGCRDGCREWLCLGGLGAQADDGREAPEAAFVKISGPAFLGGET